MQEESKYTIIANAKLSGEDHTGIAELKEDCDRYEQLDLPLIDDEQVYSDQKNYMLAYDGTRVIGYLALQDYREIELYGMVHPDYRRRGIGTALLANARVECLNRGRESCLLVHDAASHSGRAFVEATGAGYTFSEYSMRLELEGAKWRNYLESNLDFRRATEADIDTLVEITASAFGDPVKEVRQTVTERFYLSNQKFYLALAGDLPVGSVRLAIAGDSVSINTFGVRREYQGRGYGRQILAKTIEQILKENRRDITIEVNIENPSALTVYLTCGFQIEREYRYYTLQLLR